MIAGALLFRMAGVWVCLLGTGLKTGEKAFTMLAYTPKATVQAAIGGIPLAVHSAHHARLRCGYRGEVRIGFSELGISGLLHQLGVHRRELGGLRAQPQARRPSLPRRLCVRVAPRAASAFERALWPASSAAQDAHGAAGDVLLARREPAACSAMRIVASSPCARLRPRSRPRPSRSRPALTSRSLLPELPAAGMRSSSRRSS